MSRMFSGVLVVFALLAGAPRAQQHTERVPVLVELFTSEGCNSCPPADRILETLTTDQPAAGVYVVGLSEHVTYWDRLGWKDPFGSMRFTARQNMYAYHFKLDGAYTPQVVVDGAAQMVGSDTAQLKNALAAAAKTPKPALSVVVASAADNAITATATGPGLAANAGETRELLWAITEDKLVVDVKRGENANKTLRHGGVVRALVTRKIDGAAQTMSETLKLQPEWKRENLRLVAFVQATKSKRVLSVGWHRMQP